MQRVTSFYLNHLFHQRSRGLKGNKPVVLSNDFHVLRKLLHTSQGLELGKEMESGYSMGPMDLALSYLQPVALCQGDGFPISSMENAFTSVYITLIM